MAGHIKSAFVIGVSSLALGMAVPAHAQDATAGDDAASQSEGIGEIIVTSQRREENLQDVPVSVSAFGADDLLARGTTDIGRLEGLVPGFRFA